MKQHFLAVIFVITLMLFTSCGRINDDINSLNIDTPVSTQQTGPDNSSTLSPEVPIHSDIPDASPTPMESELKEKPPFTDTAVISEDGKTITVHNANELLFHMESDRHFLLMPGDYDVYKTPFSDPYKPVFENLHNVILEGVGEGQIDFFTGRIDYDVLYIANCKDITFINLNLGHAPKVDYDCAGAVISVDQCQGLKMKNCTLFGCGTYGIIGYDNTDLAIQDSTFRDCKADLIYLSESKKIVIDNCYFYNYEDEKIDFYGCQDVAFRNCELIGDTSPYPSIYFNNENIFDYPSNGNIYSIAERKYSWGTLQKVNLAGNRVYTEISEKLAALHDGVTVDLEKDIEGLSGLPYVSCTLTYPEPLLETEFLKQINEALIIVRGYFNDDTKVLVTLDWPGGPVPDIIYTWYEKIWIHSKYNSLENVMQDSRTYLTIDEAKDILLKWLPPVVNINNLQSIDEEKLEITLINTEIDRSEVFYLFRVDNRDNHMVTLSVNAVNGSISQYFDGVDHAEVSYASAEQLKAVMAYLEENNIVIADDATWRVYIVNSDYLILISSKGGRMGPYRLYEKEGRLLVEFYPEYTGD